MASLSSYSKKDLIWIINRMCGHYLRDDKYALDRALSDLELEKERERYKDAQKLNDASFNAMMEYYDLLSPYEGQPITVVPMEVLKKADSALKRSRSFSLKYNKLMGIGGGSHD